MQHVSALIGNRQALWKNKNVKILSHLIHVYTKFGCGPLSSKHAANEKQNSDLQCV
jgi:hypothetical protein